jgi:tRNA dimethylallyltransferase
MADITARKKIPLLVGGTMLYFKALREGLSDLPPSDPAVRAALDAEIAQHGIQHLHRQLAAVDAATAARLAPNDTQRIQRAMEIYRITGSPMSALIKQPLPANIMPKGVLPYAPTEAQIVGAYGNTPDLVTHHIPETGRDTSLPYRILPIALIPSDRAQLHARIAARFKTMLEQGLLDELRRLRKKYPLHANMPSMRCVGYRQAWQYLEGEISEAELLDKGIAATRQLAKRQLTWLRSMPDNVELDCLAPNLAQTVLGNI